MPASTKSNITLPRRAGLWSPVILSMVFIFYVSSIPGKNIPGLFPYQDIVFHAAVYSVLAFFFARALKNTGTGISAARLVIFSMAFACIYGITDELHQAFVPYRTVSGIDVLIDSLGGLIGGLVYKWLR